MAYARSMTVTTFTWKVRRGMRVAAAAAAVIGILSASESRLGAQRRQNPPPPGAAGPNVPQGVSPDEFDQLFNSFVLMQAQQELRLRDDQYGPFATRLRNLQMVRRRAQVQRMRVIGELRRLTQGDVDGGGVDENQVREQLHALDEIETRTAADVRQAQANLDQLLDVRQQARFRLLEERVDRQKVDLLGRVRQAGRQGGARNPNPNRGTPQF
jgi:hypothetical protein